MTSNRPPSPKRISASEVKLIAIILIALALVALYANVQRFRRDKIETVTVTPAETPAPSPTVD